jgi:hypothetical protein
MLKSLPDLCLHTPTFILYSNEKKFIGEIIHTELLIFHHVMPLGRQAVRMQQKHTVRLFIIDFPRSGHDLRDSNVEKLAL